MHHAAMRCDMVMPTIKKNAMLYQLPIPKYPEVFENLVCDLLNEVYKTTSFSLYGRKGQKQHGIDILYAAKNYYCDNY